MVGSVWNYGINGIGLGWEGVGERFGCVSLSEDGTIVAVRAMLNDGTNGRNSRDQFGRSVAVSFDGTIVVACAPFNDGNGVNSGHVRVYEMQKGVIMYDSLRKLSDCLFKMCDPRMLEFECALTISAGQTSETLGATLWWLFSRALRLDSMTFSCRYGHKVLELHGVWPQFLQASDSVTNRTPIAIDNIICCLGSHCVLVISAGNGCPTCTQRQWSNDSSANSDVHLFPLDMCPITVVCFTMGVNAFAVPKSLSAQTFIAINGRQLEVLFHVTLLRESRHLVLGK